jgi:retron-type reverse transcriptase
MRPLGIAALEDKIVQQAVVAVLNAIYEEDFLGFSYGFRPGHSQHDALDALWVGLTEKKVNWVLDADIRGFFDTINDEWLMQFIHHRVADPRILRLIRKWLRAGVSEDGEWSQTTVGTPQGAVITPPTMLQNRHLAPAGALNKRAGADPVYHANILLVYLNALHQRANYFAPS